MYIEPLSKGVSFSHNGDTKNRISLGQFGAHIKSGQFVAILTGSYLVLNEG